MPRNHSLQEWFEDYAVRFEKVTTRAEFDTVMRNFLSVLHVIALQSHWNNGSQEAGEAMRRIIAVFQRFREPAPQVKPDDV